MKRYMVRAFIGILIPDEIKGPLTEVGERLKALGVKGKFIESENLHISLSFLGEVGDTKAERINPKLDDISKSYEKFEITIDGILLIPNGSFIRVIAADVKSDLLESLRKEIVKNIGGKSHSAHLTLARISSINERDKFREKVNRIYPKLTFKIDSVCLIKSELGESGPIYTILHKSHLK